jgi:Tfp pilus assembly protein PilP
VIRVLAVTIALCAACGGDDPAPAAAPAGGAAKPAARPGAKKPLGKVATLTVYPKVEDRVGVDEREAIRHSFKDRDFIPDPTGTENRDPFRSYVITIPGSLNDGGTGMPVPVTEFCKDKKRMVAVNYNLRDLRLVGIVTRGASKYALFQDTRDYGRIVHKGDCLGREKARVKDIGAGFVTLEIIPELVPNQAPRPNEERSIPLYPEELKLEDLEDGELPPDATGTPATPGTPPTGAPTAPVMPTDEPVPPIPPPPGQP